MCIHIYIYIYIYIYTYIYTASWVSLGRGFPGYADLPADQGMM